MQKLPFTPAFIHARRPFPAAPAWQRGVAQYVIWGREGGNLDFTITAKQIGRSEVKPMPVHLITPAGKTVELPLLEGTKPFRYSYKATENGPHKLICEAGPHAISLQSPNDISCLVAPRGAFHFVGVAGPLYFVVPAGVQEFGVSVAGGGGTELVKATVMDAKGQVVATKDNIGRSERLPFSRANATEAEIWSLKLEHASTGVIEDVFVLLAGVPSLLSATPETTLHPPEEKAPKIVKQPQVVLIGDSLVATYPNPPPDRPTLTGWGQVLGQFLRPGVGVRNEARSGASSKSFLVRGFWQKTIDGPAADYLLIQFGGNDPKPDDRFTDSATTYRDFLRGYIEMARGLGMKPVLVSNPVSREFDPQGKIITTLDAYVAAMRGVAEEEKVPFIDLQNKSKAFFEKLGPEACEKLNASAEDHAHFSREGALAMARLAAEGLRESGAEYAELVKPESIK
jgi:lysophospholipase L1-like esterase